MRVVFIGASKFGLRCLDLLNQQPECQIAGVVTAPQKFSISYRTEGVTNVLYADIDAYCRENCLECFIIHEGMKSPALISTIQAWKPEIFIVSGWYHMIPKAWRDLAPAYGLHASLLPDYSGGAPLVWAMINGESKTGITLFKMLGGVDNGPVVGQAETAIYDDDTIGTLYARIEDLGLKLLKTYLPALANGTAPHLMQDESYRRLFPQRGPQDGEIGWSQDARSIVNFIRAQTKPYPGAFTTWQGKRLIVWKSRLVVDAEERTCPVPGQVLPLRNTTLVQAAQNFVEIIEASYEEKIIKGHQLRSIIGGGGILGR